MRRRGTSVNFTSADRSPNAHFLHGATAAQIQGTRQAQQ